MGCRPNIHTRGVVDLMCTWGLKGEVLKALIRFLILSSPNFTVIIGLDAIVETSLGDELWNLIQNLRLLAKDNLSHCNIPERLEYLNSPVYELHMMGGDDDFPLPCLRQLHLLGKYPFSQEQPKNRWPPSNAHLGPFLKNPRMLIGCPLCSRSRIA